MAWVLIAITITVRKLLISFKQIFVLLNVTQTSSASQLICRLVAVY